MAVSDEDFETLKQRVDHQDQVIAHQGRLLAQAFPAEPPNIVDRMGRAEALLAEHIHYRADAGTRSTTGTAVRRPDDHPDPDPNGPGQRLRVRKGQTKMIHVHPPYAFQKRSTGHYPPLFSYPVGPGVWRIHPDNIPPDIKAEHPEIEDWSLMSLSVWPPRRIWKTPGTEPAN